MAGRALIGQCHCAIWNSSSSKVAECGHRAATQASLRNPLEHLERASTPPSRSLPAYSLHPTTSRAEKPPSLGNPLQHKILYARKPPHGQLSVPPTTHDSLRLETLRTLTPSVPNNLSRPKTPSAQQPFPAHNLPCLETHHALSPPARRLFLPGSQCEARMRRWRKMLWR